jgi:hypothetical protein
MISMSVIQNALAPSMMMTFLWSFLSPRENLLSASRRHSMTVLTLASLTLAHTLVTRTCPPTVVSKVDTF